MPWLTQPITLFDFLVRQLSARGNWLSAALLLLPLLGASYLVVGAAMSLRRTGLPTARLWLAPAAMTTLVLDLISVGRSVWEGAAGRSAYVNSSAELWPFIASALPLLCMLAVTALVAHNRQAATALAARPHSALAAGDFAYDATVSAGQGLQYFSAPPVRADTEGEGDSGAALAQVAWGAGLLALALGVTRCITFLIAHGGLHDGPYLTPWSYGPLRDQLPHWGEFAQDAAGPLLVVGGALALKLRRGAWRFLGTGALLLLVGLAIERLSRWPHRWGPGAALSTVVHYASNDLRMLIPVALLLGVVVQRAVRAVGPETGPASVV